MTLKRSKYPALQIPNSITGDLRVFLEAAKERLEITTGDRGDPRDRLVTVRDIEAAGIADVKVASKWASLTGGASAATVVTMTTTTSTGGSSDNGNFDDILVSSLDSVQPAFLDSANDFIVWNTNQARLQRVPYDTLRQVFLSEDSDAEFTGFISFQNDEFGFEIRAEVPRFRLVELPAGSETLVVDSTVWDWSADAGVLGLDLVSDDDGGTLTYVRMLEFVRTAQAPSHASLLAPLRITTATGHLDVTPSAAATFAALTVRNAAGTEIWRLNSEVDGDLDFARQSGSGLFRLNGVSVIDAGLFTTGTLDDARLSANVPLKNTANTFALTNTFTLTPVVPDSSWTYAKIQNVSATARVLGRVSALAGVIEELTGADVAALINYTAADVFAKVLTLDGVGSGLDADLLDGVSSSGYATTAQLALKLDIASYTAADVFSKVLTLDGPGSGLDADLLDGISSAGYLQTATYEALTPTWLGNHTWVDNAEVRLGTGGDLRLFHDGSKSVVRNDTGDFEINLGGTRQAFITQAGVTYFGSQTPANTLFSVNFETAIFFHRNNNPTFRGVAYGSTGTLAAPAALSSGNGLLLIGGGGYDGAAFSGNMTARINFKTSEAWTASAHGSQIDFEVTANGTVGATPVAGARLAHNGQWLLSDGTAALPGLSWMTDPDTGPYRISANRLGVACAAAKVLDISTAGLDVTGALSVGGTAVLLSTSYTAADVLAKLLTVDGAGSGLDADTLDSLSSAAFFQTANVLLAVDGTAAAPAYSFASDPDTGPYRIAANSFGVATAGVLRCAIDSSGRHLIGLAQTSGQTIAGNNSQIQLGGSSQATAAFSMSRYSADTGSAFLALHKSRGTTVGSVTTVNASDVVGTITFSAADGTNLSTQAGDFRVLVDAAPSAGVVPGQWQIRTANSAGVLVEALRINSAQQCLFVDGTAAAPELSFLSDADCGLYRIAANTLGLAIAGAEVVRFGSAGINISASNPVFRLIETDAAADEGWWRTDVNSRVYRIRAFNDAESLNAIAYAMTRGTGATPSITDVSFGNATDNPTTQFLGTGVKTFGGAIRASDGTVALPGISLTNDTDCGLYRITTNEIGIGTNATLALGIDSTQRIYGKALHNNASSPTGTSLQYIASGTYTPTLTNTTNVAASTAFQCQWMRVGNVVTVSGRVSVDPTAAGQVILGISLPLASNLGAVEDCAGTACASGVAGLSAAIWGDAANDRAALEYIAVDLTNQGMSFTFTYEII